MKKKSSIRLLLLVCSFGFCAVFGIGYYFITNQQEEIYEAEPETGVEKELTDLEENPTESMEISTIASQYEYVLCEEDGYVIVYLADRKTIYANTDIRIDKLSEELQKEVKEGKPVYSESELYNFLENYSS